MYACRGLRREHSKAPACKSSEVAIDWNQTGPAGAKGDTGQQGPAGKAPLTVATGATGFGQVDTWGEVARAFLDTSAGDQLLIEYSANASCNGSGPSCPLRVLVDGVPFVSRPTSTTRSRIPGRSEYRAFSTLLSSLPAGPHQISVEVYTSNGTAIGLANGLLKVTSY